MCNLHTYYFLRSNDIYKYENIFYISFIFPKQLPQYITHIGLYISAFVFIFQKQIVLYIVYESL